MDIVKSTKEIIRRDHLENWLNDYPWLTGQIGNMNSPIWFIGENPSRTPVKRIDQRSVEKTENLQWNSSPGDRLLREAISEAGLKHGSPESNEGWNCLITNAIKEPDFVGDRNQKKRDPNYMEAQAERWRPVLQEQIDSGSPRILVALGGQAMKILKIMMKNGLRVPSIEKIHHYAYIMNRPEPRTKRGPRHPDRILEFKNSVREIANQYSQPDCNPKISSSSMNTLRESQILNPLGETEMYDDYLLPICSDALSLANLGLRVFPAKLNSHSKTLRNREMATTNSDIIRNWNWTGKVLGVIPGPRYVVLNFHYKVKDCRNYFLDRFEKPSATFRQQIWYRFNRPKRLDEADSFEEGLWGSGGNESQQYCDVKCMSDHVIVLDHQSLAHQLNESNERIYPDDVEWMVKEFFTSCIEPKLTE